MTDKYITQYTEETSPTTTDAVLIDKGSGSYKYAQLSVLLSKINFTTSGKIETTSTATDSIKTAGGAEIGGNINITNANRDITSSTVSTHYHTFGINKKSVSAGSAGMSIINNSKTFSITNYNDAGTLYDTSRTGYTVINSIDLDGGLMLGTYNDKPVIIGRNNAKVIEIGTTKLATFAGKVQVDDTSADAIYSKGGVKADGDIGDGNGWVDYSATSTITGWSTFGTKVLKYKVVGKIVYVNFNIEGTSNSQVITFTLPKTSANVTGLSWGNTLRYMKDNGTALTSVGVVSMLINTQTVTCYKTLEYSANSWTNANTKQVVGQFFYEIQ